jgi:hypothetical protein
MTCVHNTYACTCTSKRLTGGTLRLLNRRTPGGKHPNFALQTRHIRHFESQVVSLVKQWPASQGGIVVAAMVAGHGRWENMQQRSGSEQGCLIAHGVGPPVHQTITLIAPVSTAALLRHGSGSFARQPAASISSYSYLSSNNTILLLLPKNSHIVVIIIIIIILII